MARRITATAIAGSLVLFGSVACGTTSENAGDGGGKQRDCQGADGEYVIGMSQANVAEPYRERMDDDIATAAKKVPQFTVEFNDAEQKNDKQVSDVENFLTQQIDLLIISPNEAKPLTKVVKKAYDNGIPVIVLDRKVEGDAYTTFIGADNTEIGRKAGEYMAGEVLPDGGKIAELRGLSGSTPAAERANGFREAIEGKGIEIVAKEDGDWLREKGQEKAEAILQSHPEIKAIYAHNDPMAEGAYIAAKAVGKHKSLKLIGIDGLPIPAGGMRAVEKGRLSATFVYPTGGKEAIEAAKTLLVDCKDVPKKQTLKTELITKDNATAAYREANS